MTGTTVPSKVLLREAAEEMLTTPIFFVSGRGALGGYEVTGWRYVEDAAWHVKVGRKSRYRYAKAHVIRDGVFDPETVIPTEKIAILSLIAQWEARLPDTVTDFLDFNNPD